MPPYESDSSGDEGSEYTETNVLLGYASKEPTDDNFSQLGGQPTWIHPATPPSFALAKCATCSSPMPLLLQINGDMPHVFPGHSRRLYVFGCRRKACARKPGSVRALRATLVDAALAERERAKAQEDRAREEKRRAEDAERRRKQGSLGSALFGGPTPGEAAARAGGGGANPFAVGGSAGAGNPASNGEEASNGLADTFAQKARIAAEKDKGKSTAAAARPYEPWPADAAALAKPYPAYHLDADYETLAPEDNNAIPANARIVDAEADEAAAGGEGKAAGGSSKEEKEIYESLMDKTFQTFADRLAQNPEQVLRYEWRGVPLLYNRKDAVGALFAAGDEEDEEEEGGKSKVRASGAKGLPRCGNCGAERVFEVQLTPQAIAELEAEELGLEGMEWGTVIVGVCAKDCAPADVKDGQVGYLEEWVGVQWEEVAERRK
ncbi:programmed cell death protein 2 [Macrophomina phaseolina]|uniref:Programmed cell death protein 2 n=1 Tax=Macrophomina phaseolina TaxID=35725 RepID=A0ABQ8G2G0_9PEZI|nr:programmed cell death protein 2 [Macrophomina phaseolina]